MFHAEAPRTASADVPLPHCRLTPAVTESAAMKLTPMLEQYLRVKSEHPDALLFFRLGDFYEMFFEDAERAAPILEVALTTRSRKDEVPIPMCGVPYHAVQRISTTFVHVM